MLVLILAALALGFVLTNGSSSSNAPADRSSASAVAGAAEVQRMLRGIPQHGNLLGSPTAPVTMVEYVDLQCPYCQQFETAAMPALISRYVRTGKVKVEARTLAFIGPDSQRGRDAALAAADQNKLFNFIQLLYLNQGAENTGWLDDQMIEAAARRIPGLRVQRLLDQRNSTAVGDEATNLDAQATAGGVNSTPTILIGKSGGALQEVTLNSPTDEQSVAAALDAAAR